jgi:hypothetical protein
LCTQIEKTTLEKEFKSLKIKNTAVETSLAVRIPKKNTVVV